MRTMYDGISPLRLPAGADLYAGYDDGRWPDADKIAQRFPGKRVLRITTNPADRIGDVLDVERGDAKPTDIVGWLLARRQMGAWPSVYCSYDSWTACRKMCTDAKIAEPPWWIADYTPSMTPLRKGAVAWQYASTPGYDISRVADYWPGVDPRPTAPTKQEDQMTGYDPISGGSWGVKSDGSVYAFDGAPYLGGLNNHPEWNTAQVGTVAGIVAWKGDGTDAAGNGYAIYVETPSSFALYRFPRSGALAKG